MRELLLALLLLERAAGGWTAEAVYQRWRAASGQDRVVLDPDGLLSEGARRAIAAQARERFGRSFVSLCVLERIDAGYFSEPAGKIDAVKFAEELIFRMLPDKQQRDDSLLAVYSVADRVYRLRTGAAMRRNVTDAHAAAAAEFIKDYLRAKQYDRAFVSLFERLSMPEKPSDLWVLVFALVMFVAILLPCWWVSRRRERREQKLGELARKLKTLEEMKKSDRNFKDFRQEHCMICLERTGGAERADGQKASLADGERQRREGEVFLPCGHNFHRECIAQWMRRKSECPLCKLRIADDTPVSRAENLAPALVDLLRFHYAPFVDARQFDEVLRAPDAPASWSWNSYAQSFGEAAAGDSGPGYSYDGDSGGSAGDW